ncbi:MAG: hypothetical protein EB023_13610 [Flavobacteriia bacterium]|nr:hypothetical protein [Flavobacteriia bacterium]
MVDGMEASVVVEVLQMIKEQVVVAILVVQEIRKMVTEEPVDHLILVPTKAILQVLRQEWVR